MTIVLDMKVSLHESRYDRMGEVRKSLDLAAKHLSLIRELSTIVHFDFILFRSAMNFQTQMEVSQFEDLLKCFKFFRTYRKFRKR
jgi:hypothetical protein